MSDSEIILPAADTGETGPYAVTGSAVAKPGLEDALEQQLLSLVVPTRKEPGVLAYHVHHDRNQRGKFVFYEVWESATALEQHLQQPYIQAFLASRFDWLAEDMQVIFLKMASDYQ